jgi:hypothetical protein
LAHGLGAVCLGEDYIRKRLSALDTRDPFKHVASVSHSGGYLPSGLGHGVKRARVFKFRAIPGTTGFFVPQGFQLVAGTLQLRYSGRAVPFALSSPLYNITCE